MSAFENMLAGYNAGTGIRRQREADERSQKFNALAGQAYGAQGPEREQYIGQAVGVDAQAGFELDKNMRSSDDERSQSLVNAAKMLVSAPEQYRDGIYQRLKPTFASKYGMQMPDVYDETVKQAAQSLVDAYSPSKEGGLKNLRIGADGYYYAVQGNDFVNTGIKADSRTKVVEGANGYEIIDERAGSSNPVMAGDQQGAPIPQGSPQAPPKAQGPAGQLNPVADFPDLASKYGAQVSSLRRDPQRNAAVGGKDNSYHLTGEAGDFVVPQAQKQAFMADAQARGYDAIDEGDHIHLEPKSRGTTAQQFAQGQQLRPRDAVQDAIAKKRAEAQIDIETAPVLGQIRAETAGAERRAEAGADAEILQNKRASTASDALDLLDLAEEILPQATGSTIGRAYDAGAGFFGKSTSGAEATAQLKAISGQLVAKMPRMEGAQSNADVQMYQLMAGDLANADLPKEQRLAALKTIRQLNQKYAWQKPESPNQPASPSSGAPLRRKFNPATGKLE